MKVAARIGEAEGLRERDLLCLQKEFYNKTPSHDALGTGLARTGTNTGTPKRNYVGLMRSLLFVLSGECSLGAHGLLRFRTNDVLLGTSGVGVCVSVVSNSLGIFYYVFMLYRSPRL